MNIGNKIAAKLFALSVLTVTSIIASFSIAGAARAGAAREEGRLLTATEVLEDVQSMPDQRLPDTLLAHAYGIAVIPDVTKIAFFFGGRHGNGVLTVRDTLNSPAAGVFRRERSLRTSSSCSPPRAESKASREEN